jgi:type I restriction enzyme M protein
VGAADIEDDDVPFEDRFQALKTILAAQFEEGRTLERRIGAALEGLEANG